MPARLDLVPASTLILLIAFVLTLPPAQTLAAENNPLFSLSTAEDGFLLTGEGDAAIEVPTELLAPVDERKKYEDCVVNPFKFGTATTSFPVHENLLGIHASSFDALEGGSLWAAYGTDVFLLYDPKTKKVVGALNGLGLTKGRYKNMGCRMAWQADFYAQDINGDHKTDIGMVKRDMRCVPMYSAQFEDFIPERMKPFTYPIKWYLFDGETWTYREIYDGLIPRTSKLPLLDMSKTTVDFLMELEETHGIHRQLK